jgi:hypothetical protein
MKYFLDFEFIEGFHKPLFGKRRHFIDLISIGIASEDNRGFYYVSKEYNYKDADQWVKDNVILKAYTHSCSGDCRNSLSSDNFHKHFGSSIKEIRDALLNWIGDDKDISFYGYYSDYDWVLFCSMFGRMIDLPKGFPMYCIDLKQTLDEKAAKLTRSLWGDTSATTLSERLDLIKTHPDYPKQKKEHIALYDAIWNKELYKFLQTI